MVRHFEYIGGTSSKFWEISRSGSEVTVAFGRIGTNGQTQVKDLSTHSAAIAHVDKLIAEKVGKGYVERGSSAEGAATSVASVAVAAPAAQVTKAAIKNPAAPTRVGSTPNTNANAGPTEDIRVVPAGRRRWSFPWKRDSPGDLSHALASEIKGIVTSSSSTGPASEAICRLITDADESDVRGALKLLLREPEVLFPDNYWYRPTSGLLRLVNLQRAAVDPGVARLAGEALIRMHQKRPAWSFSQAADFLGAILNRALTNVAEADLPASIGGLLALIEYINTIRGRRLGEFLLPPEPPPRFILEAVGVLQSRNQELAWRVIDELAQGPSSLALVLRRVTALKGGGLALHGASDSVLKLIELASDLKAAPTKAWRTRWEQVRAAAPEGMRDALVALTLDGQVLPELTYGGSGIDIPRAAMIALASWDDPETRAFFTRAIVNWSRSGVGAPVIGTAAVWSLASYGDRASVAAMLDVRRRIRHKKLLKRLDQEIQRLSAMLGVSAEEIGDESVDDCGLDAEGKKQWTLGDYVIAIQLGPQGGVTRVVTKAGRRVRDVPPALRKSALETWTEIATATKLLKETVGTQRQRLEDAMVDGRTWSLQRWDEIFRAHPILGNLGRRLVWETVGTPNYLALLTPGGWSGDKVLRLGSGATLKIAHPVTMTAAEQSYWQHRIVAEGIVQPFKQIFRETYFVTQAEIQVGDRSHRFSGHVIPNQMMYALAKARGWSGTMGLSGFDGSGHGSRYFPTWGVRAFIEQDWTGNDEFNTITEVSFELEDANGELRRVPIDQIPSVPFSETMRDIDLVVAVASIGTDDTWLEWDARREAGTETWANLRREYESVAAAAAAVRGRLLEEMLPRLGLANRAKVEGHFVHIRGKLGQYRIHLGSANIHMEPSGRYLCIVATPVSSDTKIYLPFEDPDLKSAEVLSKVLLLANDDKIKDPAITTQLQM